MKGGRGGGGSQPEMKVEEGNIEDGGHENEGKGAGDKVPDLAKLQHSGNDEKDKVRARLPHRQT